MAHIDEPVKELHIVGGLNEDLKFDYYIDLQVALIYYNQDQYDGAHKYTLCMH